MRSGTARQGLGRKEQEVGIVPGSMPSGRSKGGARESSLGVSEMVTGVWWGHLVR